MVRMKFEAIGDDWKEAKWRDMPTEFERDLHRLIGSHVQAMRDVAARRAPYRKGQLRNAIHQKVVHRAGQVLGIVGVSPDAKHGIYQEFGTGIYSTFPGAPRVPIVPKNGKAFKIPIGRFKSIRALPEAAQAATAIGPRAVEAHIFRMSIKGSRPQRFLLGLIDEFGPRIDRDVQRLCARYGFR